jgi:hypothetical protein
VVLRSLIIFLYGELIGALSRWFWLVLGELGNFASWGVDFWNCVVGFGGVRQFSFMGSSFGALCKWFFDWSWGVRQFFFIGSSIGALCRWFWVVLGGFGGVRQFFFKES